MDEIEAKVAGDGAAGNGGDGGDGNRWKYPVAALIIVVMLGLVVLVTWRTGQIPYAIAGPLLAAALAGLLGFRASDWKR